MPADDADILQWLSDLGFVWEPPLEGSPIGTLDLHVLGRGQFYAPSLRQAALQAIAAEERGG